MSEDDLQHPRRSAEESNFLADVFERADPQVAAFMARHNALLERVTVLERAMEKVGEVNDDDWLSREARTGVSPRHEIRRLTRVVDA